MKKVVAIIMLGIIMLTMTGCSKKIDINVKEALTTKWCEGDGKLLIRSISKDFAFKRKIEVEFKKEEAISIKTECELYKTLEDNLQYKEALTQKDYLKNAGLENISDVEITKDERDLTICTGKLEGMSKKKMLKFIRKKLLKEYSVYDIEYQNDKKGKRMLINIEKMLNEKFCKGNGTLSFKATMDYSEPRENVIVKFKDNKVEEFTQKYFCTDPESAISYSKTFYTYDNEDNICENEYQQISKNDHLTYTIDVNDNVVTKLNKFDGEVSKAKMFQILRMHYKSKAYYDLEDRIFLMDIVYE